MCNALEAFLRVMAEDKKLEKQDKSVEPPSVLVTDVSECQNVSSANCYKRSSTMQHHGVPSKGNLMAHASQEITIHFGY